MDASFNDYDNYDNADEIRQPDKVVTERLLEDTRCDFQKQMDEALRLSMQEVINQEKINQAYELIIIYTFSHLKRRFFLFVLFFFVFVILFILRLFVLFNLFPPFLFTIDVICPTILSYVSKFV